MKQHLTNRQIFAYVHHSLPWPQQNSLRNAPNRLSKLSGQIITSRAAKPAVAGQFIDQG